MERGFAETRVADIAAVAGTSSGTIHYYFETREEVLVAALRWASERVFARLDAPSGSAQPGTPALTRMARLLELAIPYPKARRDEYVLWIEMWTLVLRDPERLAQLEELSARWREFYLTTVEAGVASGEFRPAAAPEVVAERISALADGLGFETMIGYRWSSAGHMRDLLTSFAAEQLGVDREALAASMREEDL